MGIFARVFIDRLIDLGECDYGLVEMVRMSLTSLLVPCVVLGVSTRWAGPNVKM